jgi:serine/threonine protein kinase
MTESSSFDPLDLETFLNAQLYNITPVLSRDSAALFDIDLPADRPFQSVDFSDFAKLLQTLAVPFLPTTANSQWKMSSVIGEGGFAKVKRDELAPTKPSSKALVAVALKELKSVSEVPEDAKRIEAMSPAMLQQAYIEVCVMRHPRLTGHPNILQLVGVTSDYCQIASLDLITEYSSLGSLEWHLSRSPQLSWAEKIELICDIARGLQAIHSCDIVHNDVKGGNVLLFPALSPERNIVAKISDFGCSVPLATTTPTKAAAATRLFAPPEAYSSQCEVKFSRDIFSFGLVVLHFAIEKRPFAEMNQESEIWEIKQKTETLMQYINSCLEAVSLPHSVVELINDTLHSDPTERLSNLLKVDRYFFQ